MSELDPTDRELGPGDSIEEGERFAVSPITQSVYRVSRWIEGSDPEKIRALDKQELSEQEIEQLPEEVRSWIQERIESAD
jgi:hypothetical protein